MFRFGLAGIPLSSKGRTLKDAIEDTHRFGLSAIEIQLFRIKTDTIYADDYVGQRLIDIDDSLIIDLVRNGKRPPKGYDVVVEEGDSLYRLHWSLVKNLEELQFFGDVARELDIKVSFHGPYYVDLAGRSEYYNQCMDHLLWTCRLSSLMGASPVVTQLGPYLDGVPHNESVKTVTGNLRGLLKECRRLKIKPVLGIETSGKQKLIGSFDEVMTVASALKNSAIPVINFAHIHARENGTLNSAEPYRDMLERVTSKFPEVYTQFSGVIYENGNEKRLASVKGNELKFDYCADVLMESELDATVISTSPLLEHDAQYMRLIMERRVMPLKKRLQKKKEKENEKAKPETSEREEKSVGKKS